MTRAPRRILATAATLALLAATASAAAGSDTTVSFEVQAAAGGLSISQAAATATLSSNTFSAGSASTASGTLPETTVTDVRGTVAAPWTVTVSSAAAFSDGSGNTVALTNARVYNNVADLTALQTSLSAALTGMTVSGGEYSGGTSNLSSSYTLLAGNTTLGNGSVDFTPAVSVTVPAATPAGTYTTTVSVAVS